MQAEMLDYHGRGMLVLEMSHRSSDFADIAVTAEANFRQLLDIPEGYSVLFLQGGASAQFSLCVQNLDIRGQVAYADTVYWSRKAIESARALTNDFLDRASSCGFVGLKGHKSVGGLCASLYNAVTDRAVDALVDYLNSFAEQYA